VINREGGAIEHFAGDGILVHFGAVAEQPDHAERAARTALELVRVTDALAADHPGWPRFRIGMNTGPAAVATVGAAGRHNVSAIGDTTNLGARLAGVAEPGRVVIGAGTHAALRSLIDSGAVEVEPLGRVHVKGKKGSVEAWILAQPSVPR
jgi:class 3 adenylate cyclase